MAQLAPPLSALPKASFAGKQAQNAPDKLFEIQLVFLSRKSQGFYQFQQAVKRVMDLVLAVAGLVAVAPVFGLIALLVKVTSPGPVFYLSERIGKGYRPFMMYKFRTMAPDADRLRDHLREKANLKGELFKLENDPRVTPFGRFLRATSLDELPQLLNVIRGEMSLVGPRPLPPDESKLFEVPYTVRYQVFPGITGMWQVNGRSDNDFKRLCDLEMEYVMGWSVWQDIKLLFQTVPAVLMSRGAY